MISSGPSLRTGQPFTPPPPISTSGADVVKPSFQPGKGNTIEDSTIAGRTIEYFNPGVFASSCSPMLFV